MTAPRLPPELERIIFETAAWNDPPTMQSLALVAHRVCIWIEPLVCRVVRITDAKSLLRIQTLIQKKPSLAENMSNTSWYLDLWTYNKNYPELLDDLQVLTHLRHLSVHLQALFCRGQPAASLVLPPPDRLAAVQLLTHVSFFGGMAEELLRMINNTTFPALTHIAHHADIYTELVPTSILRTCGQLQLLVCYYYLPNGSKRALDLEVLISDPRFCVVECQSHQRDWEQDAWGEEDLWSRAEKCIAARASRSVE
ncbi:hypothetical protein C8F01DRAFT_1255335 [Mycena amicta]|nr:hypothetical protein C8F01DRAFT_1255335 [Mycena amicta]